MRAIGAEPFQATLTQTRAQPAQRWAPAAQQALLPAALLSLAAEGHCPGNGFGVEAQHFRHRACAFIK